MEWLFPKQNAHSIHPQAKNHLKRIAYTPRGQAIRIQNARFKSDHGATKKITCKWLAL